MTTISRRGFLGLTIGGVVAGAAVRTWPFRVFSFPSEIETKPIDIIGIKYRRFHIHDHYEQPSIWYMNIDQEQAWIQLARKL